jgi:hypothetical protein
LAEGVAHVGEPGTAQPLLFHGRVDV